MPAVCRSAFPADSSSASPLRPWGGVLVRGLCCVGITTVYVTHDQEEAMAVSDRIAVMDQGRHSAHRNAQGHIPAPGKHVFVATFIGRTNMLDGQLTCEDGKCVLTLPGGYAVALDTVAADARKSQDVRVSVRPEEFIVSRQSGRGMSAVVTDSVFLGLNTHYTLTLATGEEVETIQESSIDSIIEKGQRRVAHGQDGEDKRVLRRRQDEPPRRRAQRP